MRDLSLHLMDILQNSITAKASKIEVKISADQVSDDIIFTVSDNGTGMDEDFLKQVTSPFTTTRTTRKIGLGVPLFKEAAELAGGTFEIYSAKNQGTTVKATFKISHLDRLPLGDITETMVGVILSKPETQWVLQLSNKKDEFSFDSYEVIDKLGGVPITEYEVITWVKEYIDEGIKFIFGGVLHEIIS
ncbi:MAG: ATP-binding protein [Clostridia bacterium]|nr:ATP-binding protein [Clostridia bacterium]